MTEKLNILFLCTGNSCRSQMAEGWTRYLLGNQINAYSAGIETHGLNPDAVKVMAETGVDISGQKSQSINEFRSVDLDAVITVCGHANEFCPVFPETCNVIHVGFDDPPKMAEKIALDGGSEEAQLECYRKVRDEIKKFVQTLPGALGSVDI